MNFKKLIPELRRAFISTDNLVVSQSNVFVALCGEFGIIPSSKEAQRFRNNHGRLFDYLHDRRLV